MTCSVDRDFLRTIGFYLKIAEMVCSVVIWICVGSAPYFPQFGGGGFINFSATITIFVTLIIFLLYLFAKIQILPGPWILIEVITISSSALLFLISMIIAAARKWQFGDAAIAAAVFCAVAMVLYLVEFFFRFKVMRVEGFRYSAHLRTTETTTTTTTTTTEQAPYPSNTAGGPYIIGA